MAITLIAMLFWSNWMRVSIYKNNMPGCCFITANNTF